jgi:Na+/proline symporter
MHKERPYSLVDAAKFGLYGGIAAIMIALVGMVDAFERKDIIADVVTMSQVLLGAMAFTPAFLAASRAQKSRGKGFSLIAGGVAGAIAALLVALLALAIVPLNLRATWRALPAPSCWLRRASWSAWRRRCSPGCLRGCVARRSSAWSQ